ncbi:MAG: CARDB domain-containing protein [archaeon]
MKNKILLLCMMVLLTYTVFSQETILGLDKKEFLLGEIIDIHVAGIYSDISLEIITPTNSYRYLGIPGDNIKFVPKEKGDYQITASDSHGSVISKMAFKVSVQSSELGIQNHNIKILNSKNEKSFADYHIKDMNGNILLSSNSGASMSLAAAKYDVDFNINRSSIKEIKFKGIVIEGELELGFEELDNTTVRLFGKDINKIYAIDPTKLKFDNATVTAIASGQELYKCKDYNFMTQTCWGEYVKVMDIIPGEEYSFILTPEDPQYTESTSSTIGCSCTNSCNTAPGTSSQCTASCTDYCDINFNIPPGAIDGWLEKVHYSVTITIGGTGLPVTGDHTGRLDKDSTPNSGNDQPIGSSTATSTISTQFVNNDLLDRGADPSFDDISCATWSSGYCTWKPYLTSDYTCSGSRKSCVTTISLTLINYTWNYSSDTTPPTISLGNPQNNSYSSSASNSFYYTPDDDGNLKNCSIYINTGLNATNSSLTKGVQTHFTINNMANSLFSWYIKCFDTSGNSQTSGTKYITVDTLKPGVSFIPTTPANDSYLSVDNFKINISHLETNPDKLRLYWQGSPTEQYYYGAFTNISKTGLSAGVYQYYAWVNDSAGNTNQTGTMKVTIDLTDPGVVLNEPSNGNWINYNLVSFNITPSDTNLYNCTLYGNFTASGQFAKNETITSPVSGSKNKFNPVYVGDGFYVWNSLCYDKAGRSNWASANYSLKVDATLPSVTIQGPPNKTYWNSSSVVDFNFTVTDNFNVINNCTLIIKSNLSTEYYEKTPMTTGIMQNFTATLANNKYNWTILCTDPAGNTNAALPGYYNLTVFMGEDLVGPTVVLNKPANGNNTNNNNITFFYTPTDGSLIHNCSIFINNILNVTHTKIFNGVSNNFTINRTREGNYEWQVYCTDNSTNKNIGSSNIYLFTVDQTSPVVTLSYPQANFNTTINGTNYTWYALDALSQNMYCDLVINNTIYDDDRLTINNTLTNRSVSLNVQGGYFWNVTCFDSAYNYYSTPTRRMFLDNEAPYINLLKPENNNVTLTENISLFYVPSDNITGIGQCNLTVNGVFNQTKVNPFNNIQNNFTLQRTRSGDYTWLISCIDNFNNSRNSETRSFRLDVDAPQVNSYSAVPQTVNLSQSLTITVNVTDNFQLANVTARVVKPQGQDANFTMNWLIGNLFTLVYTDTNQRGTYNVTFYSNDTYGNRNISDQFHFYVVAGISVDKVYYDRGETVLISGSGFDPYDNVTLNITDPGGLLAAGFPDSIKADISGNFNYPWTISTSSGIATGNYTILGYDTFLPGQQGKSSAYIVRKPIYALEVDKNTAGTVVTGTMNESDNNRVLLTAGSGEDYISFNWSSIVPPGQVLSDIRLYFQHYESAAYPLYIQYWNITSNTWNDVCTIPQSGSEVIDTCDLNDEVKTSVQANRLLLKATDKSNLGPAIGNWLNANFVFIELRFTTLSTDRDTYAQGDNATISGSRWPATTDLSLNISKPGGQPDLMTTTTNYNGDFSKIYQVPYDGGIGRYNVTVYVISNPEDSDTTYFDVVKRNSSIRIDKTYYSRSDTMRINGTGFSSGGNVSLLVYDARNYLRLNITLNASWDFNGTIGFNWSIPYLYDGFYGKHTIIAVDKLYPNLNGTANATIGIMVDAATKIENSVSTDVKNLVNTSNDVYSTLSTYTGVEDRIVLEFDNSSLQDYVLSNITLYVEHKENQNYNLLLKWWNDTTWIEVCQIPYYASDIVDACNLLPYVQRSIRTKNLTLKITDNSSNLFTSGQPWTNIDSVYLATWSEPDTANPSLKVISPEPDSIYNYSQSVIIRANLSDNVGIDRINANVTWLGYSQIITLSPYSIDYYGDGIYQGVFYNTSLLAQFNVSFYANDTSGNINYSEKSNFSIKSPDLFSNASFFGISNTNPVEMENISINLTIFNLGNLDSNSFVVRFYDGAYQTGLQIGEDIIVSGLLINKNLTVNMTWKAVMGTHIIQALIDAPIQINGTVWEINESNNMIQRTLSIPAWNIYYGNSTGMIKLEKDTEEKTFMWNSTSGGNIYAVETGSNINWLLLQGIGRNISNQSTFNDFFESDKSLLIENETDSVNRTYTLSNIPILLRNISIYNVLVKDVPFANSTNSSYFQTGILWDRSDGNTEYNGTQDLVFITQVNREKPGKYGTSDYEIRIPATLDTYKLGSGTVTFYTELV